MEVAAGVELLPGAVYKNFDLELEQGETVDVIKFVSIFNSKVTTGDLIPRALDVVNRARCPIVIMNESAKEWEKVWNKCDVQVGGDRLS